MATLKTPVTPEDHIPGRGKRSSNPGGVRRLRMSSLWTGLSHRQAGAKAFWQRAAFCIPQFSLERDASSRRIGRGNG